MFTEEFGQPGSFHDRFQALQEPLLSHLRQTFGKESGAVLKVLGDDAPLYYRMLKNSTSRRTFLVATSYGKPGIKRLAKMGEKGFLKSLKPVVKTSRLTKLFSKHVVDFLERVPVGIYILMSAVSLLFLV